MAIGTAGITALLTDEFLLPLHFIHHAVVQDRPAFTIDDFLCRCLSCTLLMIVPFCRESYRREGEAARQRQALESQHRPGSPLSQTVFKLSGPHVSASSPWCTRLTWRVVDICSLTIISLILSSS